MADTVLWREIAHKHQQRAYGEMTGIVLFPTILAENFELNHSLLNLVPSKHYCGFEREDPPCFICVELRKHFYSGLFTDVAALTDVVKALLLKNTTPPPASVKAVEESYVTCGGPYPYHQCLATDGNASGYQDNIQAYVSASAINYNQGNAGGHRSLRSVALQVRSPKNSTYRAPTPPTQVAPSNELANYMKVNETNMRAMQNQINNMKTELKNEFQATMFQQNNKLENMLSNYFQMNKPPSSSPLPSNTVTNPKGLKAITTQSGVSYDGPPIPPPFSSSPKVVEREPEVTKDPVQPSTEKVQPPDVEPQAPTSEPVNAPKPKPDLHYPLRLNNQKL
ncbi:hypothetical protein Tco_0360091 [Tanacetum coccineum]